jgi:hypothetical protein
MGGPAEKFVFKLNPHASASFWGFDGVDAHACLNAGLTTMPRAMTSRAKAWRLNRDGGRPVAAGSSQAKALTCMTTSRGKNGRAPGAGFSLQAGQSFLEEAFAPLANDLAGDRQAGSNLVIALALSGQKDHFSPEDVIIW